MTDQSITQPQWLIEQRREMNRRTFDIQMNLARLCAWQAQHAPTAAERERGRTYVGVHLTAALACAEGGPQA